MSPKKKVLRKFTVLSWAAFIVILGCMQPAACRWDTPPTTSTQTKQTSNHLEVHAPGARDPVVEAQDNVTGHQGSQHEGR